MSFALSCCVVHLIVAWKDLKLHYQYSTNLQVIKNMIVTTLDYFSKRMQLPNLDFFINFRFSFSSISSYWLFAFYL